MRKYFNFIISLVILFTLVSGTSKPKNDIPDIDAFAKRVFEILISQDSIAYKNELEITDFELTDLMTEFVKNDTLRLQTKGLSLEKAVEKEFTIAKKKVYRNKKTFFDLKDEFSKKRIDIKKCTLLTSTFNIENEIGECKLIIARIKIIFIYEGEKRLITIRESTVANQRWKILSMKGKIDYLDSEIMEPVWDCGTIHPKDTIPAIQVENLKKENTTPKKTGTPNK